MQLQQGRLESNHNARRQLANAEAAYSGLQEEAVQMRHENAVLLAELDAAQEQVSMLSTMKGIGDTPRHIATCASKLSASARV